MAGLLEIFMQEYIKIIKEQRLSKTDYIKKYYI